MIPKSLIIIEISASFLLILLLNGLQYQPFAMGDTTSLKNINLSRMHVAIWFYPPFNDDDHRYNESNLKALVNLVSSKFGAIAVDNTPLLQTPNLIENITNKVVTVPLVVANHNKKSNSKQHLQVMISFDISSNAYHLLNLSNSSYLNSFEVGKHYADKANKIHPNTVDTFLMHHDDYLRVNNKKRRGYTFLPTELQSVRESLNKSNASPNATKYKLGITISTALCGVTVTMHPTQEKIKTLLPALVEYADLIIPIIYIGQPSTSELKPSEEHAAQLGILSECEENLKNIKIQIEIIPLVICSPPKSKSLLAISNFLQCWQLMSDWAQKNNRKIIMFEAFDRYYRDPDYVSGVGWWRLQNDSADTVNETLFWEKAEVDFLPSKITIGGLKTISFDHRVSSHQTVYSERELMTMLQVVTNRFPNIVIHQAKFPASLNASTNNTEVVTWIPQLVAKLNSERRKRASDTFQISSVLLIFHRLDMELNNKYSRSLTLMKALEVAQNANKIFPGTVSTLVYNGPRSSIDERGFSFPKNIIEYARNGSLKSGLRLGFVINLNLCEAYNLTVFVPLVKWLKIFIFDGSSVDNTQNSMPRISSRDVLRTNLWNAEKCKKRVVDKFPNVEVMVRMNCSAVALENMALCVHTLSKWGKENRVGVILSQAFDIPFIPGESDLIVGPNGGWWKFDENLERNITIDSFQEKLKDYLEYPTLSTQELTNYLFIIWTVVGIALFILLSVVIIQTIRLIEKQRRVSRAKVKFHIGRKNTIIFDETNVTSKDFMKYKYDEEKFQIAKQEFKFDSATILGEGNYGVVYKLTVSRFPNPVAVKVPQLSCSEKAFQSFLSEIKIMSFIGENKHVVQFLGAYTKELQRRKVYIVTELCEMGSLQSHLFKVAENQNKTENKAAQRKEFRRFCEEIASGMKYISEKGVIHGDLATRNVLLDKNLICKISDFGLSKNLYQYQIYTKKQKTELPWRWLAVETLKRWEFSVKSDVWAYGVTVWEIFSLGDIPYPSHTWNWNFVAELERGMRMKRPEIASSEIYSKMLECWEIEPDQRPDFQELMSFFRQLNENQYINYFQN
ncbi:unnamed protein product [Orchesella dallaii]|uniref:Protein kinase domain-containing protein n=1 Tax=Orchesella dallaii TaxID=48710 RepID=A0ABP1S7L9_9HEXA